MTVRIDQAVGALVLQHHGFSDGYDVNSRSAVWACRQVPKEDDWTYRVDPDTLGDVVCATLWQTLSGPITMAGHPDRPLRRQEDRELGAAWAFCWPAVVLEASHKEKPAPENPGAGGPVHFDPLPGGVIAVPEHPGPGDRDRRSPPTGRASSDPEALNWMGVLPIRHDDYEYDPRFGDGDHYIPDWKTPYPTGYLGVSVGGVEESQQERLLLSGDDAIISPGHGGFGVMGTLVHDLEPDGVMTRVAPPGVGGRAARIQTMMRVVKIDSLRKLNLTTPHNAVAWNLCPTEQDGAEGGKGRKFEGFAGLGVVYGPIARTADRRTDPPGPITPGVHGPPPSAAGAGGENITPVDRILPGPTAMDVYPDVRTTTGSGMMEKAVAFAEKFANGPFSVGYGTKDKHIHGLTGDRETIHPLHIDTLAYFADRSDEQRDAPLEFDRADYVRCGDFALPAKVYLRYDIQSGHPWLDGQAIGLWRWQTTVPYLTSKKPPTDTPGEPEDPPPPPPPPPPTTPGDNPPPNYGFPSPGLGGPGDSGGGAPGRVGGGDGDSGAVPVPSSPITGPHTVVTGGTGSRASGPVATGGFEDRPATSAQQLDQPLPPGGDGDEGGAAAPDPNDNQVPWSDDEMSNPDFVEDPATGKVYPWDPMNNDHWRWWREGFGRRTNAPGITISPERFVRQYDHGSGQGQAHTWFPQVTAFSDILIRPQRMLGQSIDFRYDQWSAEEAQAEDTERPVTMRIVGWGQETGSGWVYGQSPEGGRHRGGTAAGGIVFLPPEVSLDDLDDDFAPSGTGGQSTGYVTIGPGVYLGFGVPNLGTGGLAACGWRMSSTGVSLVAEGNSAGTWGTVFSANKTTGIFDVASGYAVGGTQVVTSQQPVINNAEEAHSVTGADTVDLVALEAALNALGAKMNEILSMVRQHGLIDT